MKIVKVLLMLVVPAAVAFGLLYAVERNMAARIGDILYEHGDKNVYTRSDYDNIGLKKFFSDDGIKKNWPQGYADYRNIKLGQYVSIGVAAVSIAGIFTIALFGRLARNNRFLLLNFFSAGLYGMAFMCILIMIANAAVLIGSIYYAEAFFIQRIHIKLLLLLAFGALFGVWFVIKAIFEALKKPESFITAENLKEEEYPKIWEVVRDVARRMNAKVPDNIVAGLEPTFYATEVKINASGKELAGETMFISLSLSRILTAGEFESIIGHELAHFTGGDVKYTTKFYPVYAGAGLAVERLSANMNSGSVSGVALLPAYAVLSFFLSTFTEAERSIGRTRELAADSLSALRSGDTRSGASALVKVHGYIPLYDKIMDEAWKNVLEAETMRNNNLGKSFMDESKQISRDDFAKNIESSVMTHPTDTHPTLRQRLDNLGVKQEVAFGDALKLDTNNSAVMLVENYEALEEKLSKMTEDNFVYFKKANGLYLKPSEGDTQQEADGRQD